jgi:hypothetical protein
MWLPLWAGQTGGDRVLTRLAESRYSAAPNGMLDLGSQTCAEGGSVVHVNGPGTSEHQESQHGRYSGTTGDDRGGASATGGDRAASRVETHKPPRLAFCI